MLRSILSRLRKGNSPPGSQTLDQARPNGAPAHNRFSASAIGILSNYNDTTVRMPLFQHLRAQGARRLVYSGPLAVLSEPGELWRLIQSGEVLWVYGKAERPRLAPEVGLLPSGPEQIEVNGVLLRHFAKSPVDGSAIRFGQLQWPPPGSNQQETVEATAAETESRIIVIGSGLEYERWSFYAHTSRWELVEQIMPGYADNPVVTIELPADERSVIVHPTSSNSYCSILDPERNVLTLFML